MVGLSGHFVDPLVHTSCTSVFNPSFGLFYAEIVKHEETQGIKEVLLKEI
jgi:hypothetical protein